MLEGHEETRNHTGKMSISGLLDVPGDPHQGEVQEASQPPHLAPLGVEEQRFYSETLPEACMSQFYCSWTGKWLRRALPLPASYHCWSNEVNFLSKKKHSD